MFTHSILAPNQLVAVDGDQTFDLPVNPLSVLLIHVSPLNDTGMIANYRLLEGLLSAIDNVRISHKGSAVVDGSGVDLAALALLWHRIAIWQSNDVEGNDERRSLVLPILFGRRAYDQAECFPETKKGEFQLTITFDIADTGFNGLRMSLETVELPDATPEFVQKVTTLATTLGATGQNDVDLPIGNVLRAILLFGTTGFAGATPVPSLGELQLLVDNRQTGFSATDFEVLRGTMGFNGVPHPAGGSHFHGVNAAGVGQEDTQQPQGGDSIDDNYVLMNLDPNWDDVHSLVTEGSGRVHVRIDAETADAVRLLPIEKVPVTRFTE